MGTTERQLPLVLPEAPVPSGCVTLHLNSTPIPGFPASKNEPRGGVTSQGLTGTDGQTAHQFFLVTEPGTAPGAFL